MVKRVVSWATVGLMGLVGCTAIAGIDTNYREVECLDSSSCSGTRPICGAENQCLACSSTHPCSGGLVCFADGSCGPCSDRSECAAGQICDDGVCGLCSSKEDCEVGEECSLGQCKIVPCSTGKATCEGDAGFCETDLSDPATCGGCDQACSTEGVDPPTLVCDGSGCSFECASMRHDCNQDPKDGCECSGSACCPTGSKSVCMGAHNDGVTEEPYYNCVEVGDHGQYAAQLACANYAGAGGSCQQRSLGDNVPHICAAATGQCVCWAYEETPGARKTAGHVYNNQVDAGCKAPSVTDPVWN